ncbi:MAG: cyclic nucleotide-binding domain-containing protein [Deltaproteobacteria bacterium]|jgi:CRP/FNR family cyclic AMP-dependent transcriptional regulator
MTEREPKGESSSERRREASRLTARTLSADALREVGLFGGLDEESLAVLAAELPVENVAVGTRVVSEGDAAREMFVVLEGELEVLKRATTGTEVRVAMLGPSSWFGEMSILDVQHRSASVRALAPSRLVRITSEHVERCLYRRDLKAYALFVMNIARELSRRLRVTDSILAHFMGSVAEVYAPRKRT